MSNNTEKSVEVLKEENLELKLDAIRKGVDIFKTDMHRHLDLILDQTSKTNGSVARAMEKIAMLEREDNKVKLEELNKRLDQHRKDLTFFTVVGKNRWVARGILVAISLLYIQEVREAIFSAIKGLL